jgi:predicted nucleotidyltransferase
MIYHLPYQFIEQLKSLPFIDEIWLFGSRARGDNQERSDIDLAIICPAASDIDWLKVVDIIENADTLLKIDCVRFIQNPNMTASQIYDLGVAYDFYNNIMRDRKVIYVKSTNEI